MRLSDCKINENLRKEYETTQTIEEMIDYYVTDFKNENDLTDDDINYRAMRIILKDNKDTVIICVKDYNGNSAMYTDSIADWQNL